MKINPANKVNKQLSALKRLGYDSILIRSIDRYSNEVVDLNREQMRSGRTPSGGQQLIYSSRRYADYKDTLPTYRAPFPVADLFLTGAFQLGMFLTIMGKDVKIYSKDPKAAALNKDYQPFGLDPYSYKEIQPKITDEYFRRIHELIT